MFTQTNTAPMVVANKVKPQMSPEEAIIRTTKNWPIVVRHLYILGPEKAADFHARWKSALAVERIEARARFMRETVYAAADLLAPKVLALADAQLTEEEKGFFVIEWARDLLSDAEGAKHELGRLVLADLLLYRLKALAQANRSYETAWFLVEKKIAPQIDKTILRSLLNRAEQLLVTDPVAALRFLNEKVWPELNALVKKSKDVPQTCISRRGKTAREGSESRRRQAAHQQERAAACSKAMKGGASKTKK